MEIRGTNPAGGLRPLSPAGSQAARNAKTVSGAEGADIATISEAAQLRSKLAAVPGIRADLVAGVRAAIDSGTYETEAKIDATVDKLLGS